MRKPGPGRGKGAKLEALGERYSALLFRLVEQWELDGLARLTVHTYRSAALRFLSWIEDRHGDQCVSVTHRDALAYLRDVSGAPAYEAVQRIVVNKVLQVGRGMGLWTGDIERLRVRRGPPPAPPALLSDGDRDRLMEVAMREVGKGMDDPRRCQRGAVVVVLALTGLRAGELGGILMSDLSWGETERDEGPVVVGWRVRRKRGWCGEMMLVSLSSEVVTQWVRVRRGGWREPSVYLFPASDGGPMRYGEVYKQVKEVAQAAGVQLHPHALRTVLANYLAGAQATPREIMDVMGHTDPGSVLRYLPRSPIRQRALLEGYAAQWGATRSIMVECERAL